MTSQGEFLKYIKEERFDKFFISELREATPEQISLIGESIFGGNHGPLSYGYPEFIEKFKKKYGIGEFTTTDKVIMNYVNDSVVKDDYYTDKLINVEGDTERVLVKKPTFNEVMKEIKKIREQ